MTRTEQNAKLDAAAKLIAEVLEANPETELGTCEHCGGHGPITPEMRTAHNQRRKLIGLLDKIENVRWKDTDG